MYWWNTLKANLWVNKNEQHYGAKKKKILSRVLCYFSVKVYSCAYLYGFYLIVDLDFFYSYMFIYIIENYTKKNYEKLSAMYNKAQLNNRWSFIFSPNISVPLSGKIGFGFVFNHSHEFADKSGAYQQQKHHHIYKGRTRMLLS